DVQRQRRRHRLWPQGGHGRAGALSRLHQHLPVPAAAPGRPPLNREIDILVRSAPVTPGRCCFGPLSIRNPPRTPTLMSKIFIRPAAPQDIPAITRIYAHAVTHGTASFEIDPPDEGEMARRHEALAAGGFPFLVAAAAGEAEPLGYAYAGPYR